MTLKWNDCFASGEMPHYKIQLHRSVYPNNSSFEFKNILLIFGFQNLQLIPKIFIKIEIPND